MTPTYEDCRHNHQCFGGNCDDCEAFEPFEDMEETVAVYDPLELEEL